MALVVFPGAAGVYAGAPVRPRMVRSIAKVLDAPPR
jgi:hypothetical protein